MILDERYVLVNEICEKNKVAMSNFSPLASDDMLIEAESVIKSGGTTVIDKTSGLLPNYIYELANSHQYTDLSGLIPINVIKEDFYLNDAQLERLGEVIDIKGETFTKKFFKPNEDILKVFCNPKLVIYPLNNIEIQEDYAKDLVAKKQFKQIDAKTFLVWY